MSAYVIADVDVHDPDLYAEYRAGVPATVEAHGGRFVVRGGGVEPVEGTWDWHRVVVLEFSDMATARRWYESDEYAPLLAQRLAATSSRMIFVEGAE